MTWPTINSSCFLEIAPSGPHLHHSSLLTSGLSKPKSLFFTSALAFGRTQRPACNPTMRSTKCLYLLKAGARPSVIPGSLAHGVLAVRFCIFMLSHEIPSRFAGSRSARDSILFIFILLCDSLFASCDFFATTSSRIDLGGIAPRQERGLFIFSTGILQHCNRSLSFPNARLIRVAALITHQLYCLLRCSRIPSSRHSAGRPQHRYFQDLLFTAHF